MNKVVFFDCVIVGGGAVGATLALALGELNYAVLLVEKEAPILSASHEWFDARTIALSYSSLRIFSQLNVFHDSDPHYFPIKKVKVSIKDKFGSTELSSNEHDISQLGAVISLKKLEEILYRQLSYLKNVTLVRPGTLIEQQASPLGWDLKIQSSQQVIEARCHLLIGAEGVKSPLRNAQKITCQTKEYDHDGVLANITMSNFEPHVAVERFLVEGAIALLPWQDNIFTLILTGKFNKNFFENMSEAQFLAHCQSLLGNNYGQIKKIGTRLSLPLKMHLASQQISHRLLLMGNAAHSLHPIAAQGLNLSLRDIWQLRNQVLKMQSHGSFAPAFFGSEAFLKEYVDNRRLNQKAIIFATDKIARFVSGGPIPRTLRAAGILLFDCFTPLKNAFTKTGMGI